MALITFILSYLLGGLTFIPVVLYLVFLCTTSPAPEAHESTTDDSIIRPGDDADAVEKARKDLGEKLISRSGDGLDVAAGYFAVCREYVPGGVNGKPPERTTPAGSTVVQPRSDSVYQSIYRGIFDRRQTNSPLEHKTPGKPTRRGGNVFYVVLRHGHIILFDDEEQLEIRHVIALAHHDVSIHNGGDSRIPEGELWIKRNAICLSRKTDTGEVTADGLISKPFFLFSENCSDKEDFYFALLRNQERSPNSRQNPPSPLQYDVKHVIDLVQKLHSSEEHMQTRWINAVIGRLFLALYKTSEVEDFIRKKINTKISRVKTPSFLSDITLRRIDMGEGAPYLTNPRLKDLTVDGECVVEADVKYTGNFRMEVAAIAKIELGSRFTREVNLVLAVVLKKIEGHILVRIKAPPSNRIWMSFQTMPKLEMSIEPIVSSRQITYTLILRQIENRIKEVFAETLVYPNWDDSPFSHTEFKKWRGGIWAEDVVLPEEVEPLTEKEGEADHVKVFEESVEPDEPPTDLSPVERSMSVPALEASASNTLFSRKIGKSTMSLKNANTFGGSSSSVDTQKDRPKVMRSGSFSAVSPVVSTDTVNVDAYKNVKSTELGHAVTGLAALSARSQASSPITTPVGSPSRSHILADKTLDGSILSTSGGQSRLGEKRSDRTTSSLGADSSVSVSSFIVENSTDKSDGHGHNDGINGATSKINKEYINFLKSENARSAETLTPSGPERRETSSSSSSSKSNETSRLPIPEKRISMSVVTSAAATAKRWGLNAFQRTSDSPVTKRERSDLPDITVPMGRGRPLPPPGMPLPPPDRKTKTAPIPVPRRKVLGAPPAVPPRRSDHPSTETCAAAPTIQAPPPALPRRRVGGSGSDVERTGTAGSVDGEGMLVVAAPRVDSEPSTPSVDAAARLQARVEDGEEEEDLPMSGFSSFKSNHGEYLEERKGA